VHCSYESSNDTGFVPLLLILKELNKMITLLKTFMFKGRKSKFFRARYRDDSSVITKRVRNVKTKDLYQLFPSQHNDYLRACHCGVEYILYFMLFSIQVVYVARYWSYFQMKFENERHNSLPFSALDSEIISLIIYVYIFHCIYLFILFYCSTGNVRYHCPIGASVKKTTLIYTMC
jgi:hypothetical protein